jgi:hypothetical protein
MFIDYSISSMYPLHNTTQVSIGERKREISTRSSNKDRIRRMSES